jgi:hypothetical protein
MHVMSGSAQLSSVNRRLILIYKYSLQELIKSTSMSNSSTPFIFTLPPEYITLFDDVIINAVSGVALCTDELFLKHDGSTSKVCPLRNPKLKLLSKRLFEMARSRSNGHPCKRFFSYITSLFTDAFALGFRLQSDRIR